MTVAGRVWTITGATERAQIEFSADGRTQTLTWEWRPKDRSGCRCATGWRCARIDRRCHLARVIDAQLGDLVPYYGHRALSVASLGMWTAAERSLLWAAVRPAGLRLRRYGAVSVIATSLLSSTVVP